MLEKHRNFRIKNSNIKDNITASLSTRTRPKTTINGESNKSYLNTIRADMKIVASTASKLAEPNQKNTLTIHILFIFGFEEPSKH